MIADAASRRRILFVAFAVGVVASVAVGVLLAVALKPRTLSGRHIDAAAETPHSAASSTAPVQARGPRPARLFGPKSFWNRQLADDAPVDPNSAPLVQTLTAEVQREIQSRIGPWIAAENSSTPLYRVGRDQARVRVKLDSQGTPRAKALQRALNAVPIPANAKPAPGSDSHLTVWQPSTDRLWELWQAHRKPDGWHAAWGGAIQHVSTSPGYYTANAWPGATRSWGASATSLPVIGGTMTLADLSHGSIGHALAIALPAPRKGVFAWPAQRSDGTGDPSTLPEGARLRLDPTLDVASLHLPPFTQMIALAAQRYGLVVRDQTHKAIGFYAQQPRGPGSVAYSRALAGQTPLDVLSRFPWDRLQVLRMHLCTRAPCTSG